MPRAKRRVRVRPTRRHDPVYQSPPGVYKASAREGRRQLRIDLSPRSSRPTTPPTKPIPVTMNMVKRQLTVSGEWCVNHASPLPPFVLSSPLRPIVDNKPRRAASNASTTTTANIAGLGQSAVAGIIREGLVRPCHVACVASTFEDLSAKSGWGDACVGRQVHSPKRMGSASPAARQAADEPCAALPRCRDRIQEPTAGIRARRARRAFPPRRHETACTPKREQAVETHFCTSFSACPRPRRQRGRSASGSPSSRCVRRSTRTWPELTAGAPPARRANDWNCNRSESSTKQVLPGIAELLCHRVL